MIATFGLSEEVEQAIRNREWVDWCDGTDPVGALSDFLGDFWNISTEVM